MDTEKYIIPTVEAPEGETRILLHTCCAPCSSAILECLTHNGIEPVIYYYNPNIWPVGEYEKRKGECSRHAKNLGLEIVDADYDHENWLCAVQGLENEPERGARCEKCFALRLGKAAEYASTHGFKVLATTLASSRWKNLDQVNAAGLAAADRYGITFWAHNWRSGGLQDRRNFLIKHFNFYNQSYCGCEFSLHQASR